MRRAEITRPFDEIVAFAEIERFLDTPVKRYSSGMSVRLAFAVAAHLEPEILLVDEVLAVGDAGFQRKSLGKMSEVADEGRTVIFVSHNLAIDAGPLPARRSSSKGGASTDALGRRGRDRLPAQRSSRPAAIDLLEQRTGPPRLGRDRLIAASRSPAPGGDQLATSSSAAGPAGRSLLRG